MSDQPGENIKIREYLLGTIDAAEREELEVLLMVDDDFFAELMLVEEEITQDYVDNELTLKDRRAFESHFLITKERRAKLKFARILRKHVDDRHAQKTLKPKERPRIVEFLKNSFRSPVFAVSVAAVAVFLAFAGWYFILRSTVNQRATTALNREYSGSRPIEPRITDLKYAPFVATRGPAMEDDEPLPISRLRRDLVAEAVDRPGAESFRALGRFYMARGNLKGAIEYLEKAKSFSPADPRILSDLGAAYLEKSNSFPAEQGGQQLKLRAQALEEFEKAIEIDPKLQEALFNKGVSLELMGNSFQAREAWEAYLRLDSTSPWTDEVRDRLRKLDEQKPQSKTGDQLLQDFLDAFRARDDEKAYRIVSRNREMITGKLIPQRLLRSFLEAGEPASKAEFLSALQYVGKLENERSEDPFWAEMAAFYASVSGEKLATLGEAQDAVFKGYDLLLANNYRDALKNFEETQEKFRSNGDKWNAGICGYWIGYTLNRQALLPESAAVFEKLFEPNKEYKWLLSQYLSWNSGNLMALRQFSKAIEHNQHALDLTGKTADLYLSQKTLATRADICRFMGQYDQALIFTNQYLQLGAAPDSSPRQRWRDLDLTASLFFKLRLYRVSASFEKEALDLAVGPLGERTFILQSNIKLGQINGSEGKYKEAFEAFGRGMETAENITDEPTKTRGIAALKLQRAHVYRISGDCTNALKDYDDSLVFFDAGRVPVYSYEAHRGRLLCYLKDRSNPAIPSEISIILDLFNDYRAKIIEEQNRNVFFENVQDTYDFAVDYEFGNQDPEAAFNYSEVSRARSLFDMQASPIEVVKDSSRPEVKFSSAVTEPLKLAEMQGALPPNVQVIEYSVLDDKILIWLIARDSFKVFKSDISASDLHDKVSGYTRMIADRRLSEPAKIDQGARELYRILLGPVKDLLESSKEICIIPDKVLFRLPFATLISPASGKYFLSEYAFVSAPSLNVYLNSTRHAAALSSASDEAVLSIGNPAFDPKDFAQLPNLESAGSEAEKVAGLYRSNIPLTGKNATKEKVIASMPNANVIHFGGHYLVNEGSPLLSGFVLSENPVTHKREDSILANYEVLGDKLSNTRLIVLAACESGVEGYYDGEGSIGASRTFLATGVPLVVASQWEVETKATAEIMVRFHKYRKEENLSTAQALRRAQLDMLEGDSNLYRDPYYWAGFVTFGGYAQF